MTDADPLLRRAADLALEYTATIDSRDATPTPTATAALSAFDEVLPDGPSDAVETIELLARVGGPATMGSAGSHYFGFVNGATLPAALAAARTSTHVSLSNTIVASALPNWRCRPISSAVKPTAMSRC